MKNNVGGFDRYIILALGIYTVGVAISTKGWFGIAVGLISCTIALTQIFPLYSMFGVSTVKGKKK